MTDTNLSAFLWSVADLLRGDYTQSEYGRVILPFTVLRRLDCVLAPTKAAVLKEHAERTKAKLNPEPFLLKKTGVGFYNVSPILDLKHVVGDADKVADNLRAYLDGFPASVSDIFNSFEFHNQITRLEKARPPVTTEALYRDDLVARLGTQAMNRRLDDKVSRGGTSYLSGNVGVGNDAGVLYTAELSGRAAPGKWPAALDELAMELQRARAFGFTAREVDDVKKQIISGAERSVETWATLRSVRT